MPRPTLVAAVVSLLLLQLGLVVGVARSTGCTTDEHHYFNSGRILVEHGFAHVGTVLQGPLPLRANQLFAGTFPPGGFDATRPGDEELLFRGRLGTLLFVLPASLVVFLWSRRLFGELGALLSLTALVLHPLWLAYSGLLLVDAQHASLLCAALAALAWQLERPATAPLVLFALLAAATLATKYLALLPLVPGAVLALAASVRAAPRGARLVTGAMAAVVLLGTGLLALHACYGFGASYGGGAWPRSASLSALQDLPAARVVLAFLPEPLLAGLDFQRLQAEHSWWTFLAGEQVQGSARYYLLVFLWRTPELLLVLGVLALARLGTARRRADLLALLVPLAVLGAYLSCATSMQLGVRYALVFVPAGCVLLGALGTLPWLVQRPLRALALCGACALALGLELARNGPDWLGYFNASSGGQVHAYRLLRDSNTDFGQHQARVEAWLAQVAPEAFELARASGARFGLVAVRPASFRADRSAGWVYEGEPLFHLGAAWYVFEVTPAGLAERAAQGGEELRRALVLALLGSGASEEARREARTLALAARDPLRLLLEAEEPRAARNSRLWLRLGREDLALVREPGPGVRALPERMGRARESRATQLAERENYRRLLE